MPRSNQAHVPQLLSLCSRAWELQQLNSRAGTTEARTPCSLSSTTKEALGSSPDQLLEVKQILSLQIFPSEYYNCKNLNK